MKASAIVEGIESESDHDLATLARLSDPFAGIFRLNRIKSYLLALSLLVVLFQSFWLYRLGIGASAHVFEVHPDGRATYIADREANMQPRSSEVVHVAKSVVALLYAWNSSTVDRDIAEAVTMCNASLASQLRREFADAQAVAGVRQSEIRSEIAFGRAQVLEQTRHFARVAIEATISRYGLVQYEGAPREERPLALEVIMTVVPRTPDLRPNGLEVSRLVQTSKLAVPPRNASTTTLGPAQP